MVMRKPPTVTYGQVDPIAAGRPVVCLGNGPSLTLEDVAYCRGRACVVAIKDTVRLAPWADVLYGGDERWWLHHGPTLTFPGPRYSAAVQAAPWATVLRMTGVVGIDTEPGSIRTGHLSGYQAINLAVLLGAVKVVLLGYDMQADAQGQDRWCGPHRYRDGLTPKPPAYHYLHVFQELVQPLATLGIAVINASQQTALTCFPRLALEEALS